MIALPAVEAHLTPMPPSYAAQGPGQPSRRAARRRCWLGPTCRWRSSASTKSRSRKPGSSSARPATPQPSGTTSRATALAVYEWSLAIAKTPFDDVAEELRYEIQVTDDDGLHLETPIKGSVRIRADKPPVAIASTVHRVVLPTAKRLHRVPRGRRLRHQEPQAGSAGGTPGDQRSVKDDDASELPEKPANSTSSAERISAGFDCLRRRQRSNRLPRKEWKRRTRIFLRRAAL